MKIRIFLLLLGLTLPMATQLGAHGEGFPEETLKSVFPNATGFTAREKTFTAEQIKEIEKASGSKLAPNDNPLEFYVALGKPPDGSGVLGIVVLVDATGPKGGIDMALGVKRDGTIARVVISENADEKGLNTTAFLDQFKGKSARSSLVLGKDITYPGNAKSAEAVLSAIRRGLQMLAVAGRR